MSMRFRRTKGLLGGLVRLNFSGGGVSASIGIPGFRVTVPLAGKARAPRGTIGIPGSGISYTTKLDGSDING